MTGLAASVIVIGDEILGGFVDDTNSGWLATRLMAHGIPLSRIHTVPDEHAAIDEALSAELARSRPRVVLTCGGIGSTPDDITYEAIAASLGRALTLSSEIARRLDAAISWTQHQGLDVDDEFVGHMMRMAHVPEGAELLLHSGGWVPALRIDVDGGINTDGGATVVVLPGVPSELRTIVTEVVEPDLFEGRGKDQRVEELTHNFPESALNVCFARIIARYPEVKLGSYPGTPMLVRLRGAPDDVTAAMAELREYVDALEAGPGAQLMSAWEERVRSARERAAAQEAASSTAEQAPPPAGTGTADGST